MTLPQILQIFYIVVTVLIAGINIAKGKVSDQQRYLSAFSIVTCVGMVGYYYEFTAVSASDMYYAIILEYFYYCFAPVFLLHFMLLYSHSKFNSKMVEIFTVYEIVIFIIVLHYRHTPNLFFESVSCIQSKGTSYIVLGHTFLYVLNLVVDIVWSVWLVYLTFIGYLNHKKERRLEFLMIFVGSVIPCLGYIFDIFGVCGHYRISIVFDISAEIVFEYIVFHYNMFNTVEQAKSDYIHDMDEGVIVTNSDGEAIFHNPAVEKIFTDVDWTDTDEISSDVISFLEKNCSGFAGGDRYYNWRRSDLMNNSHCEGYIYTVIDVTEDYEYTKQLMTLNDEALRAGQVKNIFIANISHEIKTPINSILGMNEMISRKDIPTGIRRYSDNIRSAGYTLLSLINDIMDISKLEAGKLHIRQKNYDPDVAIYEAVDMVQGMVVNKHIGLKVSVSPDMPSILIGDDVRIRQCIVNILKYSIANTFNGHVELESYCENGDDVNSVKLVFKVTDTSNGIKSNMIKHIFDSVLVVSANEPQPADSSISVALSMTKKIADMMGASIDVESVYGKGNRFTITIPQKIVDHSPLGSYASHISAVKNRSEHKSIAFTAPDANILVIDDADVNLTVARGLMKPFKMHIDTGNSGEACIDMMRKKHYDILMIDHMMPEMNGIETIKRIRAAENLIDTSNTKIIAMTGNSQPDAEEFYKKHGFDGYMTKPIEPAKIQEILFMFLPKELIIKTSDRKGEK
ncbi:MAG: response regulator [Lachnospiraceae bacterium]|nr:response regulator [Lachnospiraceae bacterium]